jgi:hypothetical protein
MSPVPLWCGVLFYIPCDFDGSRFGIRGIDLLHTAPIHDMPLV